MKKIGPSELDHGRGVSRGGVESQPQGFGLIRSCVCGGVGEVEGGGPWLGFLPTAHCRDVSSVEVLMNYHQGLKTELEARMPELTACQELGRSLLLNKSAMADEVGGEQGSPSAICAHRGGSHP